jgi:hypothetical protein
MALREGSEKRVKRTEEREDNKKRVRRALEIIKEIPRKKSCDCAILKLALFAAISNVEEVRKWKQPAKTQQKAAAGVAIALKRLRRALYGPVHHPHLDWYICKCFPLTKSDIEKWYEICEAIAAAKKPNPAATKKAGAVPDNPNRPAKYEAAHAAAYVLEGLGVVPPKSRQKNRDLEQGPYCRLAAVLYGNEAEPMFEQCRAVLNERRVAGITTRPKTFLQTGPYGSDFPTFPGLSYWHEKTES